MFDVTSLPILKIPSHNILLPSISLNSSLFTHLTLILTASRKQWKLSSGFLLALLLQPKTEQKTLIFDGFGENSTPAFMTTCNLV